MNYNEREFRKFMKTYRREAYKALRRELDRIRKRKPKN